MTDFQEYGGAHPIVKLVDDYNQILDHAFEKTSRYIVRYNASKGEYQAIHGSSGKIIFNNSSKVLVCQNCIDTMTEGTIFLKDMEIPVGLTYGSTILIITDYQGSRKHYSDGELVRSAGDENLSPGEAWVKRNSGTDLLQTINAYGAERKILIPKGIYNIIEDLTLECGKTYTLEGGGSRVNRYDVPATIGNTVLYFNGANFSDDGNGVWNDGYVYLVAKNLAICMVGNAATGKGKIVMKTALPDFTDVSLLVRGTYANNTEVLFGRGTGPVGRTGIFRNVVLDVGHSAGSYVTAMRLNLDSFLWEGGGIHTYINNTIADTRLVRLEATENARIANLSLYRESTETNTVKWFWLTPMNYPRVPYKLESIAFYGKVDGSDVLDHFSSSEGTCSVKLSGVDYHGLLKLTNIDLVEDGMLHTAVYDLSGAAAGEFIEHFERAAYLVKATLLYTEASSGDAGIVVDIGKEGDVDYYYTGATESNKAQYYTRDLTLLKHDIAAGDTISFYCLGGKVGTGEVKLVLTYLI